MVEGPSVSLGEGDKPVHLGDALVPHTRVTGPLSSRLFQRSMTRWSRQELPARAGSAFGYNDLTIIADRAPSVVGRS